jgi:hypothetical protein
MGAKLHRTKAAIQHCLPSANRFNHPCLRLDLPILFWLKLSWIQKKWCLPMLIAIDSSYPILFAGLLFMA